MKINELTIVVAENGFIVDSDADCSVQHVFNNPAALAAHVARWAEKQLAGRERSGTEIPEFFTEFLQPIPQRFRCYHCEDLHTPDEGDHAMGLWVCPGCGTGNSLDRDPATGRAPISPDRVRRGATITPADEPEEWPPLDLDKQIMDEAFAGYMFPPPPIDLGGELLAVGSLMNMVARYGPGVRTLYAPELCSARHLIWPEGDDHTLEDCKRKFDHPGNLAKTHTYPYRVEVWPTISGVMVSTWRGGVLVGHHFNNVWDSSGLID